MWGKSRYNQFRCTSGTRRGFDSKALRWEVVDSQGVFYFTTIGFHYHEFSGYSNKMFTNLTLFLRQIQFLLTYIRHCSALIFYVFFSEAIQLFTWVSPLQKRYWPKFYKKKTAISRNTTSLIRGETKTAQWPISFRPFFIGTPPKKIDDSIGRSPHWPIQASLQPGGGLQCPETAPWSARGLWNSHCKESKQDTVSRCDFQWVQWVHVMLKLEKKTTSQKRKHGDELDIKIGCIFGLCILTIYVYIHVSTNYIQ